MRRLLLRVLAVLLVAAVLFSIWAAIDLYTPHKVDIREFDPDEVARLDTAMWRSYYGRNRVRLYTELTELLGTQYKLNFWRRQVLAFYAAKAAFVFKDGKSRPDYEKALPDLENFYTRIRDVSTTGFDAKRAARLELEWWIVHRDRTQFHAGTLARALATTAAEVYGMPVQDFLEHGDFRARAMDIRDAKAESGGVTEDDWRDIDGLLHRSWRSLHNAVNKPR